MELALGGQAASEAPSTGTQPRRNQGGDRLPKSAAMVWKAAGDGSCLFYSIAHDNAAGAAMSLRTAIAGLVSDNWETHIPGLE